MRHFPSPEAVTKLIQEQVAGVGFDAIVGTQDPIMKNTLYIYFASKYH